MPALCDRWFGVGADGLIQVGRGTEAPFSFALTNADGSAAEMSGNGMRCVGAWLRDTEHVAHGASFDVETAAGVRHVWLTLEGATVAMGQPNFTKAAIPMRGPAWETFQDQPFDAGDGRTMRATAVSMGNPHLVLFTDEDPERYHLEHMGPALEHHEWFPERTNVEFARMSADGGIDVRVWERGVGETMACGTGACAVAVVANEAGLRPREVDRAVPRWPAARRTAHRRRGAARRARPARVRRGRSTSTSSRDDRAGRAARRRHARPDRHRVGEP